MPQSKALFEDEQLLGDKVWIIPEGLVPAVENCGKPDPENIRGNKKKINVCTRKKKKKNQFYSNKNNSNSFVKLKKLKGEYKNTFNLLLNQLRRWNSFLNPFK